MVSENENGVHDTVEHLYQAAFEERLWSQIVARLRDARWPPAGNAAVTPSTLPFTAACATPAGGYLADSITQAGYDPSASEPASDMSGPPGAPTLTALRSRAAAIASLQVPEIRPRADAASMDAARTADASAMADEQDDQILRHHFLALQIARKLEELRQQQDALQAGLGRLAVGLVLIDCDRQAKPINQEAHNILAHRDLELRGGRLTTADKRARIQLEELLGALTGGATGQAAGGGVTIRRMHGHALQIWGVPLRHEERALLDPGERPCGLLFVIDPDKAPATPERLLMEAFGLTRAETTLTLALLHGETVDEYCERTGISRNTARTHMRAIFDKLGVNKQTELIRLLSGFRLLNMGGPG
jgi:DNA-binding CsgD family transcriptional regulator